MGYNDSWQNKGINLIKWDKYEEIIQKMYSSLNNINHDEEPLIQDERYTSFENIPVILDAEDLVKALGISRTNVYNLLNSKGFPSIHLNKRVFVEKEKFIQWLDQQSTQNIIRRGN